MRNVASRSPCALSPAAGRPLPRRRKLRPLLAPAGSPVRPRPPASARAPCREHGLIKRDRQIKAQVASLDLEQGMGRIADGDEGVARRPVFQARLPLAAQADLLAVFDADGTATSSVLPVGKVTRAEPAGGRQGERNRRNDATSSPRCGPRERPPAWAPNNSARISGSMPAPALPRLMSSPPKSKSKC